jgi:hypothetical protein
MSFTNTNFNLRADISPILLSRGAFASSSAIGKLLHSHLDRRPACIAKLGTLLSETSRYLICIGDKRTAKSEHVGCARCALFRCSLWRRREWARPSRTARPATRTTAPNRSKHPVVLAFYVHQRTRIHNRSRYSTSSSWQIGIHSCRSPRLSRNIRVCSFRPRCSHSASLRADMRGCPVRSVSPLKSGAHKPPSHRTSVQAFGTHQR